MKKVLLLSVLIVCTTAIYAQKKVQIGVTEILIQSPLRVVTVEEKKSECNTSHISDMFIGLGMAVNDGHESYMPIFYGNSYDFQIGIRDVYRHNSSPLAAGSYINLSVYSYKLDKAYLNNPLVVNDLGVINKEYYRSSNLTAGLFARLYVGKHLFVDLGPYGEYAYSRRYKAHTVLFGQTKEKKITYRDGRRFNPINAGVQCSIGFSDISVYAKYRVTNCFNPDKIEMEVPRLNIGVQFDL